MPPRVRPRAANCDLATIYFFVETIPYTQKTMDAYVFPFDTCELVHTGAMVAQPASASINAISTVMLVAATWIARTSSVRLTLLCYAAFEAWHTWSHIVHIAGHAQKRVVHVLGLLMAFSTLSMIQSLSRRAPMSPTFVGVLVMLLAIDLTITWASTVDILGIASGLAVFVWIVCGRWRYLPRHVRRALLFVVPAIGMLLAMFVNEAVNCKKMLDVSAAFPYHALIEIVGLMLFASISYLWLMWESKAVQDNEPQ